MSALRPTKLADACARAHGFGMVEMLLVLGAASVLAAVAFGAYSHVSAAAKVDQESKSLRELTKSVLASYAGTGNFGSLTTERAIQDGLFPKAMMMGSREPISAWGQPVRVLATNVSRGGSVFQDAGFVVAYDNIPAKACVDLVSQSGQGFDEVSVEGISLGPGKDMDVARMVRLCNRADGADVQFLIAGSVLPNPSGPLALCNESLPAGPGTQVVACPAGQYGLVHQSRTASCSSTYGSYQWGAWTTTGQSCTPCPAPETRVADRALTCPTGQLGTWTQSRTESRSANCPLAGPNGPSELTAWNGWTATSTWADNINTCAPACVLPTPSTQTDTGTRTGSQTLACPSGQLGAITQTRPEQRTRTRSASCPAPTGSYTWGSWTAWSAWTATGGWTTTTNTCAPACSLPTPSSQTNTESRTASQTLACPSGQTGAITQTRPEQRTQTRTASCPTPTGAYTWSAWTAWSAWKATGAWGTVSSTCVAPPATPTYWRQVDEGSCAQDSNCSPPGRYGSFDQEVKKQGAVCSPATRGLEIGVDWCAGPATQCGGRFVCD